MSLSLTRWFASKFKGGAKLKVPPGPPGIPFLGNLLQARRDPLRFALDRTRTYGDISYFRIGIYKGYLLNHPDYFQHVLRANHRNYNKENFNYRKLKPVLGEGLITASGEKWLHNRRLIQPVFHRKRIGRFGSTIIRATQEMLNRWEQWASRGQPIPVSSEMMTLTLVIITESLFSADIRSSVEVVRRSFHILNRDIAYRFQHAFVAPLWVPTSRNLAFKRARNELNRLVYKIIEQRRRDDAGNDLLGMLLAARDESSEEGMTDQQLRDEVMTLMLAGHETTANLLAWTCYLLSRHPAAVRKLQSELNKVLGDREPGVDDLPALHYTRCVLLESLRLYPPVWIISRKAVDRDVIGGYPVPAGTTVTLCSYTLHRHPGFWKESEEFHPERFSKGGREGPTPVAFFPFGGGPRTCIGDHFAMMEAQLVLAIIYRRYRLKLARDHPVEPEPLVTLRPSRELYMILDS